MEEVTGRCSSFSCAVVMFCHLPHWRFLDQHLKIPHTHLINYTPSWPNIQKCSYQTTDRNIVIVISLSYITSFTRHKNRSLTMITIFLNVNLLYILHFQKYIFLFLRCCRHHIPQKEIREQKPTGTDEWQRMHVRQGPAGGAESLRIRIQSWTSFFLQDSPYCN